MVIVAKKINAAVLSALLLQVMVGLKATGKVKLGLRACACALYLCMYADVFFQRMVVYLCALFLCCSC